MNLAQLLGALRPGKTRGGVLGFRPAGSFLSQIPVTIGGTTPAPAPAPAPAPTPTPTPPKISYTDPGDKGFFGMLDYDELLAQGLNRQQIADYAKKAQYGVGPIAAQLLGLQPYTATVGKSTKAPPGFTLASALPTAPAPAAKPAPTPAPAPTAPKITYTDPGDKGVFGMKDYDELVRQGATRQQILDYAKKAQYGVGKTAAQVLGLQPSATVGGVPQTPAAAPAAKPAPAPAPAPTAAAKPAPIPTTAAKPTPSPTSAPAKSVPATLAQIWGTPSAGPAIKPTATAVPSATAGLPAGSAIRPTPTPVSQGTSTEYLVNTILKQFAKSEPGDKGVFGMKDYDLLASQGISQDVMRGVASRMPAIGPAARAKLGL